jgi:hypothetical protein
MATFGTQNTVSFALRHKYFQNGLQQALRNSLVSEAICRVDRSDLKTIENPYISTGGTITQQAVAGTYTVAALATTEDSLSVADEIIVPTHVYDFETRTANFNLITDFLDDMIYQVNFQTDKFVLNKLLDVATGTYTTPAGGFTTAANIPVICSNLLSKVAGYAGGLAANPFLVIESTDIVGFAQAQVASGFNYADSALNNGFMSSYMGIDIYVIRTGTFVTATVGTLTAVNAGHRLFGLKNLALFAAPRGVQYEEKSVSQKTGKEVVAWGYVAATIWTPHRPLFIDITLA